MSGIEVTIVDVGLGNLHSVEQCFLRCGAKPTISKDPDAIVRAPRVVFPGQGAFRECAIALQGGLGDAVLQTIKKGTPYLGICLGMQTLFESSEEAPGYKGLGLYAGEVVRFKKSLHDAQGQALKVPHMGWNQVQSKHRFVEDGEWYYFVHSYHCVPKDVSLIAAEADYGGAFCAAIARDNLFACQFHPEKSHNAGERLVKRFLGAT